MNKTFFDNFTIDNNCIPSTAVSLPRNQPCQNLSNISFTPFFIERAIRKLKIKPHQDQTAFLQSSLRNVSPN